jgi:hypothetical protein
MQTTASRYADELSKLVEAEYEKIREHISSGYLNDFAEYQRHVGMLQALRAVVEMFEIAQTNAEKI